MIQIIYMIFIASIMVGNGIYFGPCTIRQYCAILLFIYVSNNLRYFQIRYKILYLYAIFIVVYGLSSLFNGVIGIFFRQFIALYMVSIVAFLSTMVISWKFKSFKYFINSFIIVGLINTVVIYLQYFENPIGYLLGAVFVDMNDEVKMAQMTRIMQGDKSNLIGIMGDIVYNGYYMMVLPFFILYRFRFVNLLVKYGLLIFTLIALFMVGERSCFGITLLLVCYYLSRQIKNKGSLILIIATVSILAIYYIPELINSPFIQESRWVGEGSGARDTINRSIIPFIFSNLLLGNLYGFISITEFPPHNVIASGFIYAGFIGGLCIIDILFIQSKICYKLVRNNHCILIVLAFTSYTLNGLFHNPAIVTGDAMVWILWAMVLYIYNLYRYDKNNYNKFNNKILV